MENVENLTELMALKEEFLVACERHKKATEEGRPRAEIERLGKRVIILYNEIQRRVQSDPKVIQFESSQIPKEIKEKYAGF